MRSAGNVIWFVLGGWLLALECLLFGLLAACSIVGLPLLRASVEMAKMSAFPFGKEIVHVRDLDQKEFEGTTAVLDSLGFAVNILWACSFGIILFFSFLIYGILACLTVILIPFGLQSFKLAAMSIWPVGRRVVPAEVAGIVRQEKADKIVSKYRKTGNQQNRPDTIQITVSR